MKSRFPIVALGKHVRQVSQRNRAEADIEVFSVTNSEGFTRSTDYFSKEVFSKDVSNYKVVTPGQFAYNPSRINVGSIDYLRHGSSVLVSPLYIVFEGNKDIHAEYLLRYLKSDWGNAQIRANTEGAVRDSLKFKGLESIKLPLPLLDDQIRIANLLGKVEGLIAQRKQHLQQLDDLLRSVFLEMFGDPVRNERGWETKALPELCTKITDGEHLNPQFSPSGMPMVMAGNVLDHTVSFRDIKFVEYGLGESFRKKCNPEQSDILLVSRGATIGRLCRVDTSEPFCLMGSVILLKPIHKMVSTTFLVAQLKHPALYWKLFRSSGSSAQQAIYLKDVKRLVCILPPKELQLKFSDFSEKVESTKSAYRRALTELETLYSALSQQAFKGELDLLRVPMLGIQAEEEKAVAAEPLNTPAKQGIAIQLPDTDNMLNAFENAEARQILISQWLEAYCGQLGGTPFSVQHFMAAAQTRLAELHPDNDFETGTNDYEHIKAWVFEALAAGRLAQAFDDAGNCIQLKAVQA